LSGRAKHQFIESLGKFWLIAKQITLNQICEQILLICIIFDLDPGQNTAVL